ncbi:MAG: peptidylprolyl isomerase [Ruminococcaceae bacterium]|nr:peptidylprolyl isomerase [Oscillospiraceae bacterium]
MNNPIATITMADGGQIVCELYPEIAPQSVYNFIELANSGYYNGLIFHRVIPGFMIQGGCPQGTGMGGPGYCIRGEFESNGFRNDLRHSRGVLSMARTMVPDSAGSQFFIMHKDSPHLDGDYAAFGMVLSGIEVVDAIASVPRDMQSNRPKRDQVIQSITVDTKGVEYPAAEKLPDPFHR